MTIIIETLVQCNSCGVVACDNRTLPAATQRKILKEDGWVELKGNDYCNECVKNHRHTIKDKAE